METYTVEVDTVTFIVEAEDESEAIQDVEYILWEYAHDYSAPRIL